VVFVLKRDPRARFAFAPLQSEPGRALLARHRFVVADTPTTIVLIENGRAYERSDAAIRILRGLGGLWRLATLLLVLPRPLRDLVYDWVASRRYQWFGRREQCLLPTPGYEKRFLSKS